MAGVTKRSFEDPDERRTPPSARVDVVRVADTSMARMTFEPGFRWSEHVKPSAGTEWCEARHVGMSIAGTMHIVHQDGTETEITAGDAYTIEPGHDGWVVGDEPAVSIEFASAEEYAKA
jgi:quercetin dioxygenase-like cupin family protein